MLQCLDNIEAAQRQNKLFAALKQGNEAMKQLQKEVTLDDVENLMSDSAESKEYQVRCGLAAHALLQLTLAECTCQHAICTWGLHPAGSQPVTARVSSP